MALTQEQNIQISDDLGYFENSRFYVVEQNILHPNPHPVTQNWIAHLIVMAGLIYISRSAYYTIAVILENLFTGDFFLASVGIPVDVEGDWFSYAFFGLFAYAAIFAYWSWIVLTRRFLSLIYQVQSPERGDLIKPLRDILLYTGLLYLILQTITTEEMAFSRNNFFIIFLFSSFVASILLFRFSDKSHMSIQSPTLINRISTGIDPNQNAEANRDAIREGIRQLSTYYKPNLMDQFLIYFFSYWFISLLRIFLVSVDAGNAIGEEILGLFILLGTAFFVCFPVILGIRIVNSTDSKRILRLSKEYGRLVKAILDNLTHKLEEETIDPLTKENLVELKNQYEKAEAPSINWEASSTPILLSIASFFLIVIIQAITVTLEGDVDTDSSSLSTLFVAVFVVFYMVVKILRIISHYEYSRYEISHRSQRLLLTRIDSDKLSYRILRFLELLFFGLFIITPVTMELLDLMWIWLNPVSWYIGLGSIVVLLFTWWRLRSSNARSTYSILNILHKLSNLLVLYLLLIPSLILNTKMFEKEGLNPFWTLGPIPDRVVRWFFPNEALNHYADIPGSSSPFVTNLRLVFLVWLIVLLLLYKSVDKTFFRPQSNRQVYALKEWHHDQWRAPYSESDLTSAVLLAHGYNSSMDTWIQQNEDEESIIKYLEGSEYRIFGINFSDRLKNSLTQWYITDHNHHSNNFVHELMFSILALFEYYNISKLRIIAHSTGGVIVRQLNLNNYQDKIEVVGYLATPHHGAQGGARSIHYLIHQLSSSKLGNRLRIIKWVLDFITEKLVNIISLPQIFTDKLGIVLAAMFIDGQAALDLDENGYFMNKLNNDHPLHNTGYKCFNGYGSDDNVVGEGAILNDAELDAASIYQEQITANHSDFYLEKRELSPIHRNSETWNKMEESLTNH